MSQRLAIAWVLLLLVGLLLGLLLTVLTIGVVRHLRRQRQAREKRTAHPRERNAEDDADEPSSFSRPSGSTDDDSET